MHPRTISYFSMEASLEPAIPTYSGGLSATWDGDSTASPPEPLDAAIIFAPYSALIPAALRAVAKGGMVVCAGMSVVSPFGTTPKHIIYAASPRRQELVR
jgi:hypothetical protein